MLHYAHLELFEVRQGCGPPKLLLKLVGNAHNGVEWMNPLAHLGERSGKCLEDDAR